MCGLAGADEHAVAREGGDRLLDTFDQSSQPIEQRHRATDQFGGGDQDAAVAVGEFEPGTAAGDEHAERRAEAAQPLQPERVAQRQSSRKLGHLAPVRVCRTEAPLGERPAIGRAEQFRADWIGPENPRAIHRPEPGWADACRMDRQPRIADASQLEFRIIHRNDMIRLARRLPGDGFRHRRPNAGSPGEPPVSPAGEGRSTAWRLRSALPPR